MDLKLYLVYDLDLHLVNDIYLFSKFCLMYLSLLIYTTYILDDLKVMFCVVCHNNMLFSKTCLGFFHSLCLSNCDLKLHLS